MNESVDEIQPQVWSEPIQNIMLFDPGVIQPEGFKYAEDVYK